MALQDLVDALDESDSASVSTSVRFSSALQRALKAAVELGFASSANDGMSQALRSQLEAFAQRRALDEHYEEHPEARPSLAEVALELARLDHDELADHPGLVKLAATEVVVYRPDADADEVLVWAAALLRHSSKATLMRVS